MMKSVLNICNVKFVPENYILIQINSRKMSFKFGLRVHEPAQVIPDVFLYLLNVAERLQWDQKSENEAFVCSINLFIPELCYSCFWCCHACLCVSVRPVTLMQPLTDLTVCEGDIAQMEVKFSQETVEGTWMKNGQRVTASNRVHIVIDRQIHKLLIEDTKGEDLGMYSFEVPAQGISTSAKLVIQSKKLWINVDFPQGLISD